MKNIKTRLALRLINLAIKILPEEYQCQVFIGNCMKVGIIKVKKTK